MSKEYHVFYQKLGELEMLAQGAERFFDMRPESILDVHKKCVYMKSIEAEDLDDVYHNMQGEVWSTDEEHEAAQALVRKSGSGHTSMMIGDVILDGSIYWVVASFGFDKLPA